MNTKLSTNSFFTNMFLSKASINVCSLSLSNDKAIIVYDFIVKKKGSKLFYKKSYNKDEIVIHFIIIKQIKLFLSLQKLLDRLQ